MIKGIMSSEEVVRLVKNTLDSKDKKINYLRTENKLLHDSAYKDIQLEEMQKKMNEALADLYRGFGISLEERAKINKWVVEHNNGCNGKIYEYVFTPTPIGTLGAIRCTCGEEFEFKSL